MYGEGPEPVPAENANKSPFTKKFWSVSLSAGYLWPSNHATQEMWVGIKNEYSSEELIIWSIVSILGLALGSTVDAYASTVWAAIDPNTTYNGFISAASRISATIFSLIPAWVESRTVSRHRP